MNRTLSLHWMDKNWKSRGYAKHKHLIIDMNTKVYRLLENYGEPDFNKANIIEVVKKSDIYDYVKYLQETGFKETEEQIWR